MPIGNFRPYPVAMSRKNAALADNRHNFPIIGNLDLTGGHLIYRDDIKGLNLDLKLDSVNGQGGEKNSANGFKN